MSQYSKEKKKDEDTSSFQSIDEIVDYGLTFNNNDNNNTASQEDTYDNELKDIQRTATNMETMSRLTELSHTLSHMTANDMKTFEIDPNDFDLQRILKFLINRNHQNGIITKKAEVIFKDLTIIGNNTSASVLKDVGDIFFPFYHFLKSKLLDKNKNIGFDFKKLPKTRKIVKDANGFAEPGTMTLVLGRPGAGCSSLLKILCGQTKTYLNITGDIYYGGIDSNTMFKEFQNQLIYNPELDVHLPYLTVEQTINFAIGCKTPNIRFDDLTRKQYIEAIKDIYLVLFGLKHVEKTLVGNDFVRGISGGQRKRVSIAEAMVTNGTVFAFDNATRGLDASTALEFTEALRTSTNMHKITSFVTIYQASENIYELFDYVTVLYLGRQVYFGPINEAVSYFQRMGFEKSPRETSSEFLTTVTDPLARKLRSGITKAPETADDFEKYWQQSPEYENLNYLIDEKLKDSNNQKTSQTFKTVLQVEKQKYTSKNSLYTVNYFEQLKLCCIRRFHDSWNNRAYATTLFLAALIQAFINGSLFYNISEDTVGAFAKGGVIFFSLLYFCVMSLAETAALFEDKPILNKQYGYTLFHPSAELFAKQIVSLPIRSISIVVFTIVLYFLSGLKTDAGAYFTYLLYIILCTQAICSLFTLLASLMPTLSAANGLNGIVMMSCILYSSYMIQAPSMYWWFKWFAYCNPVRYAFESIILMQFRGLRMPCYNSELIPRGDGYENINSTINQVCGFIGSSLSKEKYGSSNDVDGLIYLEVAFTYTWNHMWRNLGIIFCFIIGYLAINAIIVEFYNPIVASSDKLLFIKGANIPLSLFEAIGFKDEEESIVSSKISDNNILDNISESKRSTANTEGQSLGSNDIFAWKGVDYVVPYDGQQRKLLDNVQGYVLPGTLTALMGESGAGKTTLLNVLSRRVDVGVVTGDLLINGQPLDSSFERRTGYVQQQDLHIAELTVRESLIFSARLRRPHSIPDEEKIEYVDKVIEILNMNEYADSITGTTGYGLNVEQRKKLSIATELVAKPSLLLFLDEPTSGLDSQSSWAIIQVLKELAKAGQAILCTIHQPSATLLEQFDKLLLLKRGGQTVYFGDIGKNSETLINYFEGQGADKCDPQENPAEYILTVIGAGATATVEKDWHQVWVNSQEFVERSKEIENIIIESSKNAVLSNNSENEELKKPFAAPYLYQLLIVYKRTQLQVFRQVPYIMSKFMLMVLAGLLHGFTFWNVKHTVIGLQNITFACFIALILSNPLINQIQEQAIASRELFEVRESKSNTFHWSCLILTQGLVEIPYGILFSTIYFICWYFPIQLDNEPSRAGMWWFTYCFFFQMYYITLALATVYVSPDLPSANVLIALIFSFLIAFCGVIQKPFMMPGFWKFMWRLSPFTYFINNMIALLVHDRPVTCGSTEYSILDPPAGETCGEYLESFFTNNNGYVSNPNDTSSCEICQYSVGDEYLHESGMSYSYIWRNVGIYCGYIAFNFGSMVALYYVLRVKNINPLTPIFALQKRLKRK
ncbi:ATP-binding cassette transporter snq2 [Pichia californica]|uniref:ATP-binding cassette transporter snq2 n=1 Tax=Pichia californica TaxID=460514 RepID=A0A9P6WJM8_9ASCO|nr:ATP-binding cassette transporter snq2 [[Candida] californica]KAG0688049.1 ATP-binding cassette transporter snq2 [[Candida] californica]